MNPPSRTGERDDDTIRTHVDAAVDRAVTGMRSEMKLVGQGVDSLRREVGLELRGIAVRIDGGSKASGDRFEAHKKDDERQFVALGSAIKERDAESKDSIKNLDSKLDKLVDTVNALALKDAGQTGKLAGVVIAASAAVGTVGWLLDRFVLPH